MTAAKTLLQLAGADLAPATVHTAALVLIDLQNEYLGGPLALPRAPAAIENAAKLLAAARRSAAPIFHVAHKGKAGSLFDRDAARGAIAAAVAPLGTEPVVEKGLPNAFAGTDLQARLAVTGRRNIIIAGLMTHMCVSSTARAALDLGLRVTIDAASCATRDLPDGRGGTIGADLVHEVVLAELSDRFAIVARDSAELF
jgi:nicotinamidase-related amidase